MVVSPSSCRRDHRCDPHTLLRLTRAWCSRRQVAANLVIAVALNAVASAGGSDPPQIESNRDTLLYEDDAPGPDDGTLKAPTRSLFQTDAVALKIRLPISWALRDPRGVAWLSSIGVVTMSRYSPEDRERILAAGRQAISDAETVLSTPRPAAADWPPSRIVSHVSGARRESRPRPSPRSGVQQLSTETEAARLEHRLAGLVEQREAACPRRDRATRSPPSVTKSSSISSRKSPSLAAKSACSRATWRSPKPSATTAAAKSSIFRRCRCGGAHEPARPNESRGYRSRRASPRCANWPRRPRETTRRTNPPTVTAAGTSPLASDVVRSPVAAAAQIGRIAFWWGRRADHA